MKPEDADFVADLVVHMKAMMNEAGDSALPQDADTAGRPFSDAYYAQLALYDADMAQMQQRLEAERERGGFMVQVLERQIENKPAAIKNLLVQYM